MHGNTSRAEKKLTATQHKIWRLEQQLETLREIEFGLLTEMFNCE